MGQVDPEDRRKHLEFIQGVVARLAQNSFLIKGWATTVFTGVFLLLLKSDLCSVRQVAVLLAPTLVFWLLDGYYLAQERRFRDHFTRVARGEVQDPFNMTPPPVGWCDYGRVLFSRTVVPIYLLSLVGVVLLWWGGVCR